MLQKTAYCQSMSISMAPTIPVIAAIITFLAHITAGNNLTAAQVRTYLYYHSFIFIEIFSINGFLHIFRIIINNVMSLK